MLIHRYLFPHCRSLTQVIYQKKISRKQQINTLISHLVKFMFVLTLRFYDGFHMSGMNTWLRVSSLTWEVYL